MYKKILHITLVVLASYLNVNAEQIDSITIHLDSALNILRSHSLYVKRLNWEKLSQEVHQSIKANTRTETFSALKIAFRTLADKHAVFYSYDDQFRTDNAELTNRYSDSLKNEWKKGPKIIGKMIGRDVYLRIPYIGATKQADIDRMAAEINAKITALNQNHPNGWIIDLRLNAGGNIRPMIAGLACFFKNGTLGYYINRDGKVQERSSILNGQFRIEDKLQATSAIPGSDLTSAKVAVLTGPGTASSGEAVAYYFQQRKKAVLLGERTAGLANATDGFVFNNGNTYFLISVASLADKNKKVLKEEVLPDIRVDAIENFSDLSKDETTIAARKWLSKGQINIL